MAVLALVGTLLVGIGATAGPAAATSTTKKVVLRAPAAMLGASCYKGRTISGKVYVPVVKGIKYQAHVRGKYVTEHGMVASQPYGNRYYRAVDSSGNVVGMWRVSMFFNGGKRLVCSKVRSATQSITLRASRHSAHRVSFTASTNPRITWGSVGILLWNKKAEAWRSVAFKYTSSNGVMRTTVSLPAGEQLLTASIVYGNQQVAYSRIVTVNVK